MDPTKIQEKINDLEKQVEIEISFDKEQKLMEQIKKLRRSYDESSKVSVVLKDTQDIINYVQTKIPSNIKSKHIDILDTLNDIRASQLDAFPEMEQIKADYGQVMGKYNLVRNKLRSSRESTERLQLNNELKDLELEEKDFQINRDAAEACPVNVIHYREDE